MGRFQVDVANLPEGIGLDDAIRRLLAVKMVSPEAYTTTLEIRLRAAATPRCSGASPLSARSCARSSPPSPRPPPPYPVRAPASVDDLIDVFDALHDASFLGRRPRPARQRPPQLLIGLVARQFTVPKASTTRDATHTAAAVRAAPTVIVIRCTSPRISVLRSKVSRITETVTTVVPVGRAAEEERHGRAASPRGRAVPSRAPRG